MSDDSVVVPLYDFADGKQDVSLASLPVSFEVAGKTYIGNAEVRLRFLPTAGVIFDAAFSGVPPEIPLFIISGKPPFEAINVNGKDIPGFAINPGGALEQETFQMTWIPRTEPVAGVGDDRSLMNLMTFHLFNFEDFRGTGRRAISDNGRTTLLEDINLEAQGHEVIVHSLSSTGETFKRLQNERGFGLTHLGRISKADGSDFSGQEASELLDALGVFFSLARGARCNPVCPVGTSRDGTRVWTSWGLASEPWGLLNSWFDPHHGEQLAKLYPGFMARWEKENWRDALQEVVYWYLQSNNPSRGIDAGIILTQTALERLSYEYAVTERRILELNGYKDLKASDKLRILLSSIDVPIELPSSLPELTKMAKRLNWLDSPHALTEVRNSLVHPEHKRRGDLQVCVFETWKLGLWYLELAILRLCGYQGTYSNRLTAKWVGQIEDVPWT